MRSSSIRRQNSSCDQCRQSKRKCSLNSTPKGVVENLCLKCLRSGQECTFNFATSQQLRPQRKRGPKNGNRSATTPDHIDLSSPTIPSSPSHSPRTGPATYQGPLDASLEVPPLVSSSEDAFHFDEGDRTSLDGFGHDNMMLNHLMAEWAHLIRENHDEDEGSSFSTSNNDNPISHATIHAPTREPPSDSNKQSEFSDRRRENSLPALWKGSPIHLLNSSVASQLLSLSLGEVYNSMMSGITTRYLDYNCNLFAGPYKYTFDSEDLGQSMALTSDDDMPVSTADAAENISSPRRNFLPAWRKSKYIFRPETLENQTFSPEQVSTQISRVTMIGVARFLDNFGPLYGNPIEREIRKTDESTLTAVLQAFALQFAPSDPRSNPLKSTVTSPPSSQFGSSIHNLPTNNAQVFTAAWHHASRSLSNTRNSRSFVHIYAVFLFQMTVVPSEKVESRGSEESPLELLDYALSQMAELQQLVEAYSSDLKSESLYRFLLDSSLAIFRWYGIVRDSIASMLHDRPCFMEDPPFRVRGKRHVPST